MKAFDSILRVLGGSCDKYPQKGDLPSQIGADGLIYPKINSRPGFITGNPHTKYESIWLNIACARGLVLNTPQKGYLPSNWHRWANIPQNR